MKTGRSCSQPLYPVLFFGNSRALAALELGLCCRDQRLWGQHAGESFGKSGAVQTLRPNAKSYPSDGRPTLGIKPYVTAIRSLLGPLHPKAPHPPGPRPSYTCRTFIEKQVWLHGGDWGNISKRDLQTMQWRMGRRTASWGSSNRPDVATVLNPQEILGQIASSRARVKGIKTMYLQWLRVLQRYLGYGERRNPTSTREPGLPGPSSPHFQALNRPSCV